VVMPGQGSDERSAALLRWQSWQGSARPSRSRARRPGRPIGDGMSRSDQHGGLPAADDDHPRVRWWFTPKAAKGGPSAIDGPFVR